MKVGDEIDLDTLKLINFENGSELELYINCFNESMRLQPPVYQTSTCCMSEDVQCGPVKMRKDDPFSISIHHLHNNPEEWFEPDRFIPERFNTDHPYYLTPAGNKRNPFSFSPFLGGSRICMGKTFIEAVSKLTTPVLLEHFEFDFEEGIDPQKFEYPHNNMSALKMPDVKVRITQRNPVYKVV